jgi:hypothetical protein
MHNSECDDTLVIHLRSGDVHFKDYNPWREKLIAVETAEFSREAWRRSGLRSMHIITQAGYPHPAIAELRSEGAEVRSRLWLGFVSISA